MGTDGSKAQRLRSRKCMGEIHAIETVQNLRYLVDLEPGALQRERACNYRCNG